MSVPGIGAKVADKILELREAKGDQELDDLNQVPYLRITPQLLDWVCLSMIVASISLYSPSTLSNKLDCCHQSPSCLL
jgi:hypothetical protein